MSIDYNEWIKAANEASDHHERVIESEPAIICSLASTPSECPAVEIGNREGGSALLLLYHILKEGKLRPLITVDVAPAPGLIKEYQIKYGFKWSHLQESQAEFVRNKGHKTYGYIYFDADHRQETVTEDIRIMAPFLAKGCVISVDDVHDWSKIPDFSEVGLEEVKYDVPQGDVKSYRSGQHILFLRKL